VIWTTATRTASSCATTRTASYFEVDHFASETDKDAYLERDWAGAPVIEMWNVDGNEQGKLYRSADDEAAQPYIITTFTDPAGGSTCCTRTGRTTP
jgi:hypothetical protein